MKTLQEQYKAIQNGQGNKNQFLKHARLLFPEYFNQYTDFNTAVNVLKSKQIISETAGGVVSKGFDIWDWKKILAEEVKAEEKETSKEVKDYRKNAYDNTDMKNADNINFNEMLKGFYCELKDKKNAGKTGNELEEIVVKNLAKDPLYYTKNGEFGVKGVGYTTEAPGLGEPKAPKGKHKSSGYGDLKEEKIKENTKAIDYYARIIEEEGMTEDEAYKYLLELNLPNFQIDQIMNYVFPIKEITNEQKLRSLIFKVIKEEMEEGMYQGPSVKLGAGGNLGGRRFIPNVTVLSKDAVDAINNSGRKRVGWNKPHIKVIAGDEGVKLMVSQLLLDTIAASERGRSKLPINVSKMGTGITPEEMNILTGEFKKLIKVLNIGGKLSKTGDYYLLDVPTKYNEDKNQYEMPLPAEVAESLEEIDDPNKFELGQENPEEAPMGVNDKSPSKPMKGSISIKSTLEKIATAVFTEKNLDKAKQIFSSHILNSGINEKDKKNILRNIENIKSKFKLDYYLTNSLLHYEGHGLGKLEEEQTLRSLIRNIIKEELTK